RGRAHPGDKTARSDFARCRGAARRRPRHPRGRARPLRRLRSCHPARVRLGAGGCLSKRPGGCPAAVPRSGKDLSNAVAREARSPGAREPAARTETTSRPSRIGLTNFVGWVEPSLRGEAHPTSDNLAAAYGQNGTQTSVWWSEIPASFPPILASNRVV